MADTGPSDFGLEIKQILSEVQHRWLRPAEICEILRNYQKFHISSEAPDKPVSGSVFLFDRKILRRFRLDGHNWRKKKDGKVIKEAHEKLKVGSVDMLQCYYAHGENNECFQRRTYWLLEEALTHIVFVHYLEVKGSRTNISYVRNSDRVISNSENDICVSSNIHGTSPTTALSSAYEDTVSDGSFAASSGFHSYPLYPESPLTDDSHAAQSSSCNLVPGSGNHNISPLDYTSLLREHEDGNFSGGGLVSGNQVNSASWQALGNHTADEISYNLAPGTSFPVQTALQHSFEGSSMNYYHRQPMNQDLALNLHDSQGSNLFKDKSFPSDQGDELEPLYRAFEQDLQSGNLQHFLSDANTGNSANVNLGNASIKMSNENIFLKKPMISGLQSDMKLQKVDSFTRWMAKELGEDDELNIHKSNRSTWSMTGNDYDTDIQAQLQVDTHTLNPSISQDQLFSIIEFSPHWAYSGVELKVLITGIFLKSRQELSQSGFSVMFGEVEVSAEVLADGILCCTAPLHKPGHFPLYVTNSNRAACSEIREFEYRLEPDGNMSSFDESVIGMYLHRRFEMILSLESVASPAYAARNDFDKQIIIRKITYLMEEENKNDAKLMLENDTPLLKLGELLLERQLKQKFYSWLVQVVIENGKGPMIVDEWGQSVLHLAGALGFNWAFQPIIASGANIDFRDVKGWSALHWAAFYGREETVAALVSLGAGPGLLTDPCGEYPLGRSPADLASLRGHKGISGFLAEIALTTQLSTLNMKDTCDTAVPEVRPRQANLEEDVSDTFSHKDSLDAVRNAAQAAARIHQIFRIKSFQRKQFMEQAFDDEHTVSLVASKTSRFGTADRVSNSAAVSIQKKYRGWKKRKEFLLIRQKVVKIQAHVRGHQARKKYKFIYWPVGMVETVLRWRHKISKLRESRWSKTLQGPSTHQEDDDDVLKTGRKQTEERMQKALARVRSMAQNPEARAQYRRLLAASEGFKELKENDSSDIFLPDSFADLPLPDNFEDLTFPDDDMLDFQRFLDDDTFMSSFQ